MDNDLEDFVIEVFSKLGVVFEEPESEWTGDMIELGFVEQRFFHLGVDVKPADIDFNGMILINAAVGCDIGIVITIPLYIALSDLCVDLVMDEVCLALNNEIDLVEV